MDDNNTTIRQKIEDWFDIHSDEMLKDLGRLIEIKSVKGPAAPGAPYGLVSREALDLVTSMLEERGFEIDMFEDIVISTDLGPAPPKMGILAHVDVVSAGEGWDTDPYSMTLKDGTLYGRGVCDDKGPSIAAMYALYCVRDIYPELKHGFRLILGSGEETGCEDIRLYLASNTPPPNVFTPDGSYPVINVEKGRAAVFFGSSWEKDETLPRVIAITGGSTLNIVPNRAEAIIEGISMKDAEMYCMVSSAQTGAVITVHGGEAGLVITAEGKATHAATPEIGLNAQTALIDMLSSMPFADSKGIQHIRALNRLFPHGDYNGRALGIAMDDEESGDLTVNFGVLRFTETDFSANFDSRTPACADKVDLIGMIRTTFDRENITLTNSVTSECHHTPQDSQFVRTLLQIYEDYTGDTGECLKMGGQTYVHDIPGGVVFGCRPPESENNIHGANEYIDAQQLIVSAKMFAQSIIDMCG